MQEIQLNLSLEETNTALKALSKLPFEQVAGLIAKIQTQAQAQVKAQQEKKEEPAKPE